MPFDKTYPNDDAFLHLRLIPKLGFAVGELFDLEALAEDCSADRRYHGLFRAAPLSTRGGAGSPAGADAAACAASRILASRAFDGNRVTPMIAPSPNSDELTMKTAA